MKKTAIFILCGCVVICAISAVFASGKSESQSVAPLRQSQAAQTETKEESATVKDAMPAQEKTNALGALSPEDALAYMKRTENLVIVEVNAPEWKLRTGFTGALHIPYTVMSRRYNEIPAGRPVLLHCGGGIVSVEAYNTLIEKRLDIPELSYIAGVPLVRAYNEWLSAERN